MGPLRMSSLRVVRMLPKLSSPDTRVGRTNQSLHRQYTTHSNNPTAQFYKTFTRPIAKVLLMAVFTYQVLYWSWVKLEQDEHRSGMDNTMKDLEAQVSAYQESKLEAKPKS